MRKWTPLIAAARHGNLPIVQALLRRGADVNICSTADQSTALHAALEEVNQVIYVLYVARDVCGMYFSDFYPIMIIIYEHNVSS